MQLIMTADTASGSLLKQLDHIEGTELPLVGGKTYRLAVLPEYGESRRSSIERTTPFVNTKAQHFCSANSHDISGKKEGI